MREIQVPRYVEGDAPADRPSAAGPSAAPRRPIFGGASDDYLLGYGVPVEWLDDVRVATEDTLLDVADHLPAEAAEALRCRSRPAARRHTRPPPRRAPIPSRIRTPSVASG